MKQQHFKIRFTAFFLLVTFFLLVIPVTPLAAIDTSTQANEPKTGETAQQQPNIIREAVEFRDEFSKHYLCEDGSYYAVVYSEPVHYMENGAWKEIDHTLTYDAAKGTYHSESHTFSTSFAQSAQTQNLISISEGTHTLTWTVQFDNDSTNQLTATTQALATVQNATVQPLDLTSVARLGKAASSVTYTDFRPGTVDLRYSVFHGKVEEDIVLTAPVSWESYCLNVQTGSLTAQKNADNSISFTDADGEAIFTLAAPWMKDAIGAVSDAFTIDVLQKGETALIVVTPDAQWLKAEERVYPILIDPSFTTRTYTSNYVDTYVYTGDTASSTRASESTMRVGTESNTNYNAYIKILNIPVYTGYHTSVSSATFKIWAEASTAPALNLSEVTSTWSANTITYATQPTVQSLDTQVTPTSYNTYATYEFDITSVFSYADYFYGFPYYWESSAWNGFQISYGNNPTNEVISVYSSEFYSAVERPVITISYNYSSYSALQDGAVYSFRNATGGKYLTVSNESASNGANVIQATQSNTRAQAFRLDFDETDNCFRIRSMCSSDGYGTVLDFPYSSTVTDTGYSYGNVQVYSVSESWDNDQQFLIEFLTDGSCKIVSKADPNLALTAYGTSNGTASGKTNTSAGNVFMSEYTGASNQKWYLESGGKQILNSINLRTTTSSSLEIYENSTSTLSYCCPVTEFGHTVTLEVSNSYSTELNASTGSITIKKAGDSGIIARIMDTNGVCIAVYIYDIYVLKNNGVYKIQSYGTGNFIELNAGDITPGNRYIMWSQEYNRNSEFKIVHLGQGIYSIRSMADNSMGWTKSADNMLTNNTMGLQQKILSENNPNGVAEASQWRLRATPNGYAFINVASGKILIDLTQSYGTTSNLSVAYAYSGMSYQIWNLLPAQSGESHGVDIRIAPNYVAIGNMVTYTATMYSSYANANGPVTWSVTNGTGSATIDPQTGVLTPVSMGTITVTAAGSLTASQTIQTSAGTNVCSNNQMLYDALDLLYSYAKQFDPLADERRYAYWVISYIRQSDPDYQSSLATPTNMLWGVTAGATHCYDDYIAYVNSNNSALQALFNGNNSNFMFLWDGVGDKTDFNHMIATACGIIFVEVYPDNIATLGANLAGWAGDLQSLVPDVIEYLENNGMETTFSNIYQVAQYYLSQKSEGHFALPDLYADVDAYCISASLSGMIMESFSDYFSYHYESRYSRRFIDFIGSMTYDDVLDNASKYMDLLFGTGGLEMLTLTLNQRDAFATAFADYIWTKVQAEL